MSRSSGGADTLRPLLRLNVSNVRHTQSHWKQTSPRESTNITHWHLRLDIHPATNLLQQPFTMADKPTIHIDEEVGQDSSDVDGS